MRPLNKSRNQKGLNTKGDINHTITIVNKLVNEDKERSSNTINPPPSTVSIVLANKFGVNASKS
jgi:hypothetical protein